VPSCSGKDCGPDGCGGTCGACEEAVACTVGGDLNASGDTTVPDVQCAILLNLWTIQGATGPTPACLLVPLAGADMDCSGDVSVVDVTLNIALVLGNVFGPTIDADADLCHDACDPVCSGAGVCTVP
jgi:hypothetical protein